MQSCLLVDMSFPVCYCCYEVMLLLLLLRVSIPCIRTTSVADLILPKECILSFKRKVILSLSLSLSVYLSVSVFLSLSLSVIVIYILRLLIFSSTSNINTRFLHLLYSYFEMANLSISMIYFLSCLRIRYF